MSSASQYNASVLLGSDVLFGGGLLRGRTIGLVCHPASIDGQFRHVTARTEAAGVKIGALFGPQHGYEADLQENMIESPHGQDRRRKIPIYSLYSETREPTPEMLQGLEAIVIDLQDVGTRIYTYIYTMANCLKAAAKHGVPVIVCDRPNPIGGATVEGPVLVDGFQSFVGQYPIPMRHGMTMGELARLFNEHFGIGAKLEVIAMKGWTRDQFFDTTGLPWVLPSPNIPTLDAAVIYPGTVLLEGTNVSEGRGTTRPFELIGAPWANAEQISAELNGLELPGVRFRPATFEPTFHKHANATCGGCQIHVLDRASFRPVETGVAVIDAFRRADPGQFQWRQPPYEYEHTKLPIDILYGSSRLREGLEGGETARELAGEWDAPVEAFMRIRQRFLSYWTR